MAKSKAKLKTAPRSAVTAVRKRAPSHDSPFQPYFSIGEAIATLFHPHVEVVLHDLRTGRIVRIWNVSTGRKAGDMSQLNRAQDQFSSDQAVLGPYEKALPSQGRTKSVTAGLRNADDELIGFLCINLDVTLIDNVTAMLTDFTSSNLRRPEPIYRNDLQQHINYLVRDYSLKVSKPIDHLTREERVDLVSTVDRAGLFQARNSIMLVARAMRVSRASVYNLLADTKAREHRKPKAGKHNGRRHGQSRPVVGAGD